MNLLLAPMMHAPSLTPGYCCICGEPRVEKHHPVRRSQGGTNGPVLDLCPTHHRKAHAMELHFRYTDRWEALETRMATKYEKALVMDGWRRL